MGLLSVKQGSRRRGEGERNTYGLPQGGAIRRELRSEFKRQRAAVLAAVRRAFGAGAKADRDEGAGPGGLPAIDFAEVLRLGQLAMRERMTPLLEVIWDRSGRDLLARLGLDANDWRVVDPNTRRMIEQAAMAFCQATNETTTQALDDALAQLRQELTAGVVDRGETLDQLTKRVKGVFDLAETFRARRIAVTETARAVHAAELESAKQSEVVAGFEWLLSEDACPLCQRIKAEVGRVRLGDTFATFGDHPTYRDVRHPPLHPSCQCSVIEVLLPDYGGPENPKWGAPLDLNEKPREQPQAPAGGLPARPVGPLGKPVSDAIALPSGPGGKALRRTQDAINKVHGDGTLPKITTRLTSDADGNAAFVVAGDDEVPAGIEVSRLSDHPELSYAHEIGHFLDRSGIPTRGTGWRSGYKSDPHFKEWFKAVESSQAAQALANIEQHLPPGVRPDERYVGYLLRQKELWARSYAQYIATRSGDPLLGEQLDAIRNNPKNPYRFQQWSDEDFKPIADAIDVMFANLGWRK
jgi:SPP1 gp7 family putative phage head morphogenesis protein